MQPKPTIERHPLEYKGHVWKVTPQQCRDCCHPIHVLLSPAKKAPSAVKCFHCGWGWTPTKETFRDDAEILNAEQLDFNDEIDNERGAGI